jgi:hypothetical protein
VDAGRREPGQALVHDGLAEALLPVLGDDCKVVQVAPATVVPTEDSTDDLPTVPGDETEAGISDKKGVDGFTAVRGRQADALALLPECCQRARTSS